MTPGLPLPLPLSPRLPALQPLASLLALLAIALPSAPVAAQGKGPQGAAPQECAAPQPGRYVVIGDGEVQGEPVARILQETWNADGSLSGVRLERRGKVYRETLYSGSYRPLSLCRVAIQRSYGNLSSSSQAVLDASGRPRYSLGTLPDVVVVSRWFHQPGAVCSASLLDGSVLSMQSGRSWREGSWRPNAVIQNEVWKDGRVEGIAISSYGSRIEEATYSGEIRVGKDCLATLQERDSLGVAYNYRAVLLADGSGYLYIQTDPSDLTVGYLEHQRSRR